MYDVFLEGCLRLIKIALPSDDVGDILKLLSREKSILLLRAI